MNNILENIKILRDKTGLGIIECKNALLKTDNDIENAILFLRKNSKLTAVNKSSRITKDGLICIMISEDLKNGVILEINCETDFVARSSDFSDFLFKISNFFLFDEKFFNKNLNFFENDIILSEDLNNYKCDLISKFKENILIKRVSRIFSENGYLFKYIHLGDNCGKKGAILNFSENDPKMALDILMQIVSMKPKFLSITDIPDSILQIEKEVYFNKFKNQYVDKNDDLILKMVDGQINKFYKDNVLLEQDFIKANKVAVKNILDKCKVYSFIHFEVGSL